MKKLLIFTLLITFNQIAQSKETNEVKDGPCKKMMDACKAADFAKGDSKMKKSLFKDCMQPLLTGQTVAGVKLDPSLIAACKKIKDAKQKTK